MGQSHMHARGPQSLCLVLKLHSCWLCMTAPAFTGWHRVWLAPYTNFDVERFVRGDLFLTLS